jgi:hypothetical protein
MCLFLPMDYLKVSYLISVSLGFSWFYFCYWVLVKFQCSHRTKQVISVFWKLLTTFFLAQHRINFVTCVWRKFTFYEGWLQSSVNLVMCIDCIVQIAVSLLSFSFFVKSALIVIFYIILGFLFLFCFCLFRLFWSLHGTRCFKI